jgi:hypothetical protein
VLAWEIGEILAEIVAAEATIARAGVEARRWWRAGWCDDELLCSLPGVGPVIAPTIRAWWARPGQFATAKQAAAFVGLNPSNWEFGLMASPSAPITKEGPPELRLASAASDVRSDGPVSARPTNRNVGHTRRRLHPPRPTKASAKALTYIRESGQMLFVRRRASALIALTPAPAPRAESFGEPIEGRSSTFSGSSSSARRRSSTRHRHGSGRPEWQAGEREADRDEAAGRGETFDSGEEFVEVLRASAKPAPRCRRRP